MGLIVPLQCPEILLAWGCYPLVCRVGNPAHFKDKAAAGTECGRLARHAYSGLRFNEPDVSADILLLILKIIANYGE